MLTERRRIGDILTRRGVITRQQLDEALELQRLTPAPLGSILAHLGFIDEDSLNSVLSDEYSVKAWNLRHNPPDPEAVAKLSGDISKSYKVLPVAFENGKLYLAMSNPEDVEALDIVRYTTKLTVEPVLTARNRLLQLIERFHGDRVNNTVGSPLDQTARQFPTHMGDRRLDETVAGTVPIITLVNQIITEAVRSGASDVHLEPAGDQLEIRYRIEGVIKKVGEVPIALLQPLTIRLKILAGIDIVENFVPVDGRIATRIDDQKVDLRLSIMPAQRGNRMMMRVLDKMGAVKTLDELGFMPRSLRLFKHLVNRPYGLFLVTGPSGSGKTTTLYGAAAELRGASLNIMSSEDPIEYEIDGVCQSQVNEGAGLTVDRQVTALMRQDPDVIIIGEIRDDKSAQVASRASLTGHMVLSTLQTNDALSAIPRLTDLGIDPVILSSSLAGVSAQRLLRTVCVHCREMRPLTSDERHIYEVYEMQPPKSVPIPNGCEICRDTGYAGRTAIHEVMPVTREVAALIAERAASVLIGEAARNAGYEPIQQRALQVVSQGNVTFEDARRMVALDPDYGTFAHLPE